MKSTKELLEEARAKIAEPEHWCKDAYWRDTRGEPTPVNVAVSYCAMGALLSQQTYDLGRASQLLAECAERDIVEFNDDEKTTHVQILAVFDCAIAKSVLRPDVPV